MRGLRGATLAELLITCGLFSTFMLVSIGLFTNMTRLVNREQKPAEAYLEGRLAALKIARRLRNCQAFVAPTLWQVMESPTDRLMMRDGVFSRSVEFQIVDGILTETYYPIDYDPKHPELYKPLKSRRLTPAKAFSLTSGGILHPTRISIEITLEDERKVRVVTNFREAI